MSEKLTSIRNRIVMLRNFLETNLPYSSITDESGQSMTVNRTQIQAELEKLESQERRLTQGSGWIRKIDMTGT
jgi:hypothetical protein